MKFQLIFLGAPGSGKGTQSERVASAFSLEHLSTGDLCRKEIASGGPLGRSIEKAVQSGKLVEDSTILELLQSYCDLSSKQYIFDGFPRSLQQAKDLDEYVLKGVSSKAFYFDVDFSVLKERLVNRRTCKECLHLYHLIMFPPKRSGVCDVCKGELLQREDDAPEVVQGRIEIFKEAMLPLLEYYREGQRLVRLNAEKDPDGVFAEIKREFR